jgi:hypothetical protein
VFQEEWDADKNELQNSMANRFYVAVQNVFGPIWLFHMVCSNPTPIPKAGNEKPSQKQGMRKISDP